MKDIYVFAMTCLPRRPPFCFEQAASARLLLSIPLECLLKWSAVGIFPWLIANLGLLISGCGLGVA